MACSTATLYDNVHAAVPLCGSGVAHPASVTPMGTVTGTGNSTGLTWWNMMNGVPYEDSPPPVAPTSTLVSLQQHHQQANSAVSHQQQQQQQQASTPTSPGAPSSANTNQQQSVPTASASSTSPSASSVASNSATGPLHIPAKRLTATPVQAQQQQQQQQTPGSASSYTDVGCVPGSEATGNNGVIRHSHSTGSSGTGWPNYSPHHTQESSHYAGQDSLTTHHQGYGGANPPTYYTNLATDPSGGPGTPGGGAASRDRKGSSLSFWSPAASTTATGAGSAGSDYKTDYKTEYKYNAAGGNAIVAATTTSSTGATAGSDPAVSCHQSFAQSWCNYPPYSTSRHHHAAVDSAAAAAVHHQAHPHATGVPSYLTASAADDRNRVAAAMEAAAYDGYGGLRNYGAPEPVTSSPYPPPGKHRLSLIPYS